MKVLFSNPPWWEHMVTGRDAQGCDVVAFRAGVAGRVALTVHVLYHDSAGSFRLRLLSAVSLFSGTRNDLLRRQDGNHDGLSR